PQCSPLSHERLSHGSQWDTGVENESSDLIVARRHKLDELRARGINPFPNDFHPTDTATAVHERCGALDREALEARTDTVSLAGPIVAMRHFGKASFLHMQDRSGRIQAHVKRDVVGDDAFAVFKLMDIGDFAGIVGRPFRTNTNELTVRATTIRLLGKALRPL